MSVGVSLEQMGSAFQHVVTDSDELRGYERQSDLSPAQFYSEVMRVLLANREQITQILTTEKKTIDDAVDRTPAAENAKTLVEAIQQVSQKLPDNSQCRQLLSDPSVVRMLQTGDATAWGTFDKAMRKDQFLPVVPNKLVTLHDVSENRANRISLLGTSTQRFDRTRENILRFMTGDSTEEGAVSEEQTTLDAFFKEMQSLSVDTQLERIHAFASHYRDATDIARDIEVCVVLQPQIARMQADLDRLSAKIQQLPIVQLHAISAEQKRKPTFDALAVARSRIVEGHNNQQFRTKLQLPAGTPESVEHAAHLLLNGVRTQSHTAEVNAIEFVKQLDASADSVEAYVLQQEHAELRTAIESNTEQVKTLAVQKVIICRHTDNDDFKSAKIAWVAAVEQAHTSIAQTDERIKEFNNKLILLRPKSTADSPLELPEHISPGESGRAGTRLLETQKNMNLFDLDRQRVATEMQQLNSMDEIARYVSENHSFFADQSISLDQISPIKEYPDIIKAEIQKYGPQWSMSHSVKTWIDPEAVPDYFYRALQSAAKRQVEAPNRPPSWGEAGVAVLENTSASDIDQLLQVIEKQGKSTYNDYILGRNRQTQELVTFQSLLQGVYGAIGRPVLVPPNDANGDFSTRQHVDQVRAKLTRVTSAVKGLTDKVLHAYVNSDAVQAPKRLLDAETYGRDFAAYLQDLQNTSNDVEFLALDNNRVTARQYLFTIQSLVRNPESFTKGSWPLKRVKSLPDIMAVLTTNGLPDVPATKVAATMLQRHFVYGKK